MTRTVGLAGGAVLLAYSILSIVTGRQLVALGDLAQMIPPLAYAALAMTLARRCRGQVRVFWNLNAIHGVVWAIGQGVWTFYDVGPGGVPVELTDPIFFVSCIPLAAALYGRPEHDRPRWQFDIVLLDLVLIALFVAFVYIYFVVSIVVTDGPVQLYDDNLRQLFNARNLVLAVWAVWVWRTSVSPAWRRMLGVYAAGLVLTFVAGVISVFVDQSGPHAAGGLWDLLWMAPYVVMALAAAIAFDNKLFEPADEAPQPDRLPVVSMIAITLLVAIPAIDEIARRLFVVSPQTESLRTRLALAMMIPFGVVVVVREFLSRRALIRASQELVATREQLVQKEKLAAVGQLVSGVAHELNNPLQGVLGYAELMLAARPSAGEAEELRAIRDNANRAASIVRNLLTFAGRTSSARGWQQINRVVRDAVAAREPHLQSSDIDIRVEIADRLPLVYIDHARLQDVLVNLIQNAENAIAARRDGRSMPSAVPRDARGEITVTTGWRGSPDRILVEVSDNGSGLQGRGSEPRLRPVLYDPRSRAGHRARPLGVLRHRARARRPDHRPQRRGGRGGVDDRAAGDGRVAGHGDGGRGRQPRRAPGKPKCRRPDPRTPRSLSPKSRSTCPPGGPRPWSWTMRNRMPRWCAGCWPAPATTSKARRCRGARWS